jgi:hypothetical protein
MARSRYFSALAGREALAAGIQRPSCGPPMHALQPGTIMPKPLRVPWATVPRVVLALVLASLSAGAAVAAPPKSLLQNGDFERTLAGHPWMPAGWDTSIAGLTTVFFGRDSFLVHGGHWSVNVANMSTAFPMGHNWSQTLIVGKETWGKTATFKVWSRSNGVEGRAYVLLQAYSDTASKMARIWGVDHDEALKRLGIGKLDDPLIDLGWKRVWFDDGLTDWVQREAKIRVPPGTNMLFVRCGLIGTGQVLFDDASLTLDPGQPPAKFAKGQNLLVEPGFEDRALAWDLALPPYEGARVEIDTTVMHSGRMSVKLSDFWDGLVEARIGVGQPFDARSLRGQRVRLSGWFKGDSLKGIAYVKVFAHGLQSHVTQSPGAEMLSNSWDWKELTIDFNVPEDAEIVWTNLNAQAPARGTVWIDDATFEVLGPAPPPPTAPKPPSTGKSGR